LHEVAFEVLADEVVGADEGDFSGYGANVPASLLGEGEWEFFVVGEVPFVEERFPFGEVVESAEDGFEHVRLSIREPGTWRNTPVGGGVRK
jgi:hypothetical protein